MLSVVVCTTMMVFMLMNWGEVILFLMFMFMLMLSLSGELSLYCSNMFNLDDLSICLMLLSIWISILCLLGSIKMKYLYMKNSLFMMVNLFLLFFLLLSFSFFDYLLFYLSFESCLIFILLMILGWGYQPERAQAGIYMLLYTLVGSFPLFFNIIYYYGKVGSSSMLFSLIGEDLVGLMFSLFMLSAFLVKFPMYSVHLWLLKAHVEAPVAGSMMLAGVLLKLGGYGMIRVLPLITMMSYLMELLVCLSLFGGMLMSISCMRLLDMKLLVASSSVVHMSFCISGLILYSDIGLKGVISMMVAHGLCSSGLFYMVNLIYERNSSRSLLVSNGMLNMLPSMSLWWFLLLGINMAMPPSINLLSEIMLIIGLVSWSFFNIMVICIISFFSAAYSLYLYSLSQHGKYFFSKSSFFSGLFMEFMVVFFHWLPLNLLILSFFYLI